MSALLKRATFEVDRSLEFFTVDELTMQLGHEPRLWPLVLVKELVDNALDACEESGVSPIIAVIIKKDSIAVWDNGPGLPTSTLERSLDYRIRVSNKTRYVSPTRGQLGNALKCVWAAPFVVDGKSGRVEVIAHGLRHTVTVGVDPVRGVPDIRHTIRPVVKNGTFIKIHWPEIASYPDSEEEPGFYKSALDLLNQYTLFNPHATFILKRPGQRQRLSASDPAWRKWLASDPTSPWWYQPDDLPRLGA